jgi:hypothetical protein
VVTHQRSHRQGEECSQSSQKHIDDWPDVEGFLSGASVSFERVHADRGNAEHWGRARERTGSVNRIGAGIPDVSLPGPVDLGGTRAGELRKASGFWKNLYVSYPASKVM